MGNNADKRARQKANRQPPAGPTGSRGRLFATIGIVLAVVVVLIGVMVFGGSDDQGSDDETGDASSTAPSTATTPCPPAEGSADRQQSFAGPPEFCIDPDTTSYAATFVTSEGTFTAQLDPTTAPQTVNNFVVLSRYGYYDDSPIHRVVPDFVIQGGDGDGEPLGSNDIGYAIDDELPGSSDAYTDYSLAMANSGPNTNGSQFFVILPGGGSRLNPDFSWFGEVAEGREVVDAIAALGTPGTDGPPTRAVTVETVDITETPI